MLTVFIPATVYVHYFASLAPALALFSIPMLDLRGALRHGAMILVLSSFLYLVNLTINRHDDPGDLNKLATAIQPHVNNKNECMFIFDGPTSLYKLSNSCLPTRFIYPDHLNNALETHALGISQTTEVQKILSKNPPIIVTADSYFSPQNESAKGLVWARVRKDYFQIQQAQLHGRVIRVWLLNDKSTPQKFANER